MLAEIDRFVNWVRRRSPNAHTWQDYRCDLNFFLETVGDRPPGQITFRDIDKFINQQVEKGFKPTTLNRRLASIAALYAFLMPENENLVCPVYPRRHHLREPERLPRPVQEAELRQFFAVIEDPRDLAIFTLMLRCGLRIGEVANLHLSDLYLDEDFPRMVVQGKGSRQRAVYLSPQAERALREYLAVRPAATSDFVFLSYQLSGLSTHAIHMRLLRYRKQAGLNLTSHRLRHSFANDLLNMHSPASAL
jgi:site-specific recombinase XerD